MQQIITVIVPAFNEQELIAGCLDSILNQTLDGDKYEIIVVDNNSTDLTGKIALSKGARLEKETKKGYVHAIRKGIEASKTELMAFTDADCRVPPDWLEKILAHFSTPDVVGVGGKQAFYDLHPVVDKTYQLILYFNKVMPGNNMAIRCQALSQIGGIDPRVNLSVDYWLSVKLRKVGVLKVDKTLVVKTSGRRFKKAFESDIKYLLNVMSIRVSSRPLFYDFPDIRE